MGKGNNGGKTKGGKAEPKNRGGAQSSAKHARNPGTPKVDLDFTRGATPFAGYCNAMPPFGDVGMAMGQATMGGGMQMYPTPHTAGQFYPQGMPQAICA